MLDQLGIEKSPRPVANVTFQDVKEFVYENPEAPFDTNELYEEHKEITKTIVNQAVKRFKKLKDDVRERRTTSGSGELDRILRQDISLDEECYGVYGDPNDPLPSAEEHFKQSQVPHGLPVLRFAGLDLVGRNSRPGEKNAVLEILRCFFVDPNAHGRTRENASRTQTDTMKVEFGLFKVWYSTCSTTGLGTSVSRTCRTAEEPPS